MSPVLWIMAAASAPCIAISLRCTNTPVWAIILMVGSVVAGLFSYAYMLLTDPSKLQSEDFQLRAMSIEKVGEKNPNAVTEIATQNVQQGK